MNGTTKLTNESAYKEKFEWSDFLIWACRVSAGKGSDQRRAWPNLSLTQTLLCKCAAFASRTTNATSIVILFTPVIMWTLGVIWRVTKWQITYLTVHHVQSDGVLDDLKTPGIYNPVASLPFLLESLYSKLFYTRFLRFEQDQTVQTNRHLFWITTPSIRFRRLFHHVVTLLFIQL